MDLERDLERYLADRAMDVRLARDDGLDFVLQAYQLDALLFPITHGSFIGARQAIRVFISQQAICPMEEGNGVTFMGRAFSEPVLIGLAYAFEQASLARRPPALTPPLQ